jgi:site-specific DNA-methyltransferase (adenine-specific)
MYRSKIELHNVDCLPFMKQFEDNHFDLAIVDPPYGIGAGSTSFKNGTRKKADFSRENDWDNEIPNEEYFKQLFRVSKNQVIWGANYMVQYLPISKGWIFWDKKTGDNSYGDGELAFTSFDKALKKYDRYWSGANAKERGDLDRIHPTQKPISLYEWLLMNYAEEGDKILDTHLGSGSSAIACDALGFDLTACELDKEYFDAASKRIELARRQQKLF